MTDKKLIRTNLYGRQLVELVDKKTRAFLDGALNGVSCFGKRYLNREMVLNEMTGVFPDVRNSVQNGELMIDDYRTDLQDFYSANPDNAIFTLDIVPYTLRTDSGRIVSASSWQHRNLETGELIDKNHAGVILTRNPELNVETNPYSVAFLLAWHEMGHLPLGLEPCEKDSCIHSHPPLDDRARLLEEKAEALKLFGVDGVPVCGDCDEQMRDLNRRKN